MKKIWVPVLGFLLAACATNDGMTPGDAAETAVTRTGDGLTDAALSPLEDLNLRRDEIPERLAALETPYGAAAPLTCEIIADEVGALTALLGPDDDLPPPGDDEEIDRAEWAAEKSSDAALGVVEDTARGFIPFRGLVREATGANRHAEARARAFRLGIQRRAYLKGYGEALGCSWPAAPLVARTENSSSIVYK